MKKNLMWVAAVLTSLSAMAGTIGDGPQDERIAIIPKGENVFGVVYKSDSKNKVKVSIYDSKNQLVFTERMGKSDGFLRPYNFSELSHGWYTIEVEDENGLRIEHVNYKGEKMEKVVNVVKLSPDNKFLFTAGGQGKELITLNIYDNTDHLLYNEIRTIAGDFGQLYTVEGIKGGCTFEVIHQNGSVKKLRYP